MTDQKLPKSASLYSTIARFYDLGLWLTGYKLAVPYFLNLLPFDGSAPLQILDAGCGTGLYTFTLLKKFRNVHITAFDVSMAMTEKMEHVVQKNGLNSRVKIFNSDITEQLPLVEKQFDLIVTGGVLEYVQNPERVVKNLAAHLKPGGYFLNSLVRDNFVARIVAKLFKFTPHSRAANLAAFTNNGFVVRKIARLPVIKEAHLFRKT